MRMQIRQQREPWRAGGLQDPSLVLGCMGGIIQRAPLRGCCRSLPSDRLCQSGGAGGAGAGLEDLGGEGASG